MMSMQIFLSINFRKFLWVSWIYLFCHSLLKQRCLLLRQAFSFIYVRRKCVSNQLSFLDYTKGQKIVSIYDNIVVQNNTWHNRPREKKQVEFKMDSGCSQALELLKDLAKWWLMPKTYKTLLQVDMCTCYVFHIVVQPKGKYD